MKDFEVKKIFEECSALLNGHFLLTSGQHSASYMQCALVLQHPQIAERFGEALAKVIREKNAGVPVRIDAVCAPAVGGIVIGHVVARALGARAIFAEREGGKGEMHLRRGFSLKPGETVLAVEDVITTGGSLKEIAQLVQKSGAKLKGVAAVVERSNVSVEFGVDKTVLLPLSLQNYQPQECPLCAQKLPLVKPGSRNEDGGKK